MKDRNTSSFGARFRKWFSIVGKGDAALILAIGSFFAVIAYIAHLSGNEGILAVAIGAGLPLFFSLAYQILRNDASANANDAMTKMVSETAEVAKARLEHDKRLSLGPPED